MTAGISTSPLAYLVGFFFSLRLVIAIFVVKLLGGDPQLASEIKLGAEFLLLMVVAFACLGLQRRTLRSLMHPWSIRWVLIFLTFALGSFLWGEAASPTVSLLYWCATAADVAMVLLLLSSQDAPTVAASLMRGFIVASCIIAVVAWLMPAQYDLRLGDDLLLNPNNIGNVCAFAVFFAQYLMRCRAGKWPLATVFLIATLLRSLSKTTIIAFAISEAILLIRDRTMTRRTKVLLTIASLLAILAFWGLFEAYFDFYTSRGNEAETFTGRTAIWAWTAENSLDRLWFGHGFDSLWKIAPAFGGGFEARHAENEVLEQLYSYGIAGVVILSGVYASLYQRVRRYAQPHYRTVLTSMVIFVVIRGLAEAESFDLLLPLWTIVLIATLVSDSTEVSETQETIVPHHVATV